MGMLSSGCTHQFLSSFNYQVLGHIRSQAFCGKELSFLRNLQGVFCKEHVRGWNRLHGRQKLGHGKLGMGRFEQRGSWEYGRSQRVPGRTRCQGWITGETRGNLPSHSPVVKIIEGIVEFTQHERLGGEENAGIKRLSGLRAFKHNRGYCYCPRSPSKTWKNPTAEGTIYHDCRRWRNQRQTGQDPSSLPGSCHSVQRR